MILQPLSSIFPCSPLPSGTWWTPGLSIPWCCLPTSSSVCLDVSKKKKKERKGDGGLGTIARHQSAWVSLWNSDDAFNLAFVSWAAVAVQQLENYSHKEWKVTFLLPYYVCPHLVEPVNCIKNVTYFSGCVTKVIMCAYKQSKAKQSKARQSKARQAGLPSLLHWGRVTYLLYSKCIAWTREVCTVIYGYTVGNTYLYPFKLHDYYFN